MPRRADRPELARCGSFAILRPLNGGHRKAVWLVALGQNFRIAKSIPRTASALGWLQPLHHHTLAAAVIVPRWAQTAAGQRISRGLDAGNPLLKAAPPQAPI